MFGGAATEETSTGTDTGDSDAYAADIQLTLLCPAKNLLCRSLPPQQHVPIPNGLEIPLTEHTSPSVPLNSSRTCPITHNLAVFSFHPVSSILFVVNWIGHPTRPISTPSHNPQTLIQKTLYSQHPPRLPLPPHNGARLDPISQFTP